MEFILTIGEMQETMQTALKDRNINTTTPLSFVRANGRLEVYANNKSLKTFPRTGLPEMVDEQVFGVL